MFCIAYNVVCVPNYSVPPYSLTPTYLEEVRFIPQIKMILIYCVKCQKQADLFSFQLDIGIPVRMDCKCKNNHDRIYFICSNVALPNHRAKITDFVKKAYHNYFGVKVGDQDTPFGLHVYCKTCGELEGFEEW